MTYYPRNPIPVYGNFNPDDVYTSPAEIIQHTAFEGGGDNTTDLSGLVQKSGDTMTGYLQFSASGGIKYPDTTIQQTALDSNMVAKLSKLSLRNSKLEVSGMYYAADGGLTIQNHALSDTMVDKLSKFSLTSNSKIKMSSLYFDTEGETAVQTSAFTELHKINCNKVPSIETKIAPFTTSSLKVIVDRAFHFWGGGASGGYITSVNGSLYVYSMLNEMVLHTGAFPLVAWTTELRIGNANAGHILMNGERQDFCFTNARKTALSDASANIITINSQIGVLRNTVDGVNGVGGNTRDIATVDSRIDALSATVDGVNGVGGNTRDIATVDSRIDVLSATVDGVNGVGGNTRDIETLNSYIGALSETVDGVNGVGGNTRDIAAVDSRIDVLSDTVNGVNGLIGGNTRDIASLQQLSVAFTTTSAEVTVDRPVYFRTGGGHINSVNGSLYVYSLNNEMVLHTGAFPLVAWTTELQIGNASGPGHILMAGERQDVCFTNARKTALSTATANITTLNSQIGVLRNTVDGVNGVGGNTRDIAAIIAANASKILLHFKRTNWDVLVLDGGDTYMRNHATYNKNSLYNIFKLPEFRTFVSLASEPGWNMGTRRITFKFNVGFMSYGSALSTFCSRFRVQRFLPLSNPPVLSPSISDDQLFSGQNNNGNVSLEYRVQYNDTMTIDIFNGDVIWFETDYYLTTEYNRSFEMQYSFGMVEL